MKMPRNVRLFECLSYATIALSIFTVPFNERVPGLLQRFGLGFYVVTAGVLGFFAVIIWGIARKRQNWLRLLMAVLFVANIPFEVAGLIHRLNSEPVYWTTYIVGTVMKAFAFYFVFTGDARDWFKHSALPVKS
jgi:hypothetical protein